MHMHLGSFMRVHQQVHASTRVYVNGECCIAACFQTCVWFRVDDSMSMLWYVQGECIYKCMHSHAFMLGICECAVDASEGTTPSILYESNAPIQAQKLNTNTTKHHDCPTEATL